MSIRIDRFNRATRAAAWLIKSGRIVYSPITMTHPIDLEMSEEGVSQGSEYWCDFDEAFMEVCSEMMILSIPGWNKSNGVAREMKYFELRQKPISMLMEMTHQGYELNTFAA
jgi:hypothetical protein